jgi:hypothetical protein
MTSRATRNGRLPETTYETLGHARRFTQLTKSEAAGADGNRGTTVPPFPQRYDCYGIENKTTDERVRLVA